ncbi:MAG: response regulator transcription factor [Planctomycetota bacterium]
MSIRVLIADDHPVVRDGLRMVIERSGKDITIVDDVSDGMEVLKTARTNPADVYILDITMPNMNGIETARELLKKDPATKIIMLSLHDTKEMVEMAMKVGARGYLSKETATRNVVDAVSEVHAGRFYLSPSISHFIVEAGLNKGKGVRNSGVASPLTGQERKVLQLIAEGHSNKEIAALMGLSVNTVHAHRNALMAKLDIHKQAGLVRYAIKAGIAKL